MILGLIVLSWIVVSVPLGIFVGRCMALKDQPPTPRKSPAGATVKMHKRVRQPASKAKSRGALPLRRSA